MPQKCSKKRVLEKINIRLGGGTTTETAATVKDAGANVLVAGTYLFRAKDMREAADAIR